MRQSGSAVGSESIENIADLAVKTLVRGMGRFKRGCWFDRGAI